MGIDSLLETLILVGRYVIDRDWYERFKSNY